MSFTNEVAGTELSFTAKDQNPIFLYSSGRTQTPWKRLPDTMERVGRIVVHQHSGIRELKQ